MTQQHFPYKLYDMLEHCADSEHSSVVSWSEDGKSFAIHKKDEFMKYVVPLFFNQNLFRSFTRQLNLWGFTRIVSDQQHDGGRWEREDFIRGEVKRLVNITRVGIGRPKVQLHKGKQVRRVTCSQEPTYAAEEVLSVVTDDNTDTLMETEQLQQEDEAAHSAPNGLPKVIPLSSSPSNINEMIGNNQTDSSLPPIPTSEIYASIDAVQQTNHVQHETSSEDFDMLNDPVQDQAVNEDDILFQLSSIFEFREMDDLSSILSLNEDFRDPTSYM